MVELPVWVWVVSVLGVIAAGIGLGYLIIFLFWKIEKYFNPAPMFDAAIQPEEPIEESFTSVEPIEEPLVEEVEEEIKEEPAPIMHESISDDENRFIKFATVLHARFKHPFTQVNTIVCWDIGLENGDEVRDPEGNVMKYQTMEAPKEDDAAQSFLVDESGQKIIKIISGKQYMKRESNLDVDKMRLSQ